jgi:threonine dehydrogenase-like Zn-dependent dehydrogenase
LLEKKEVSTILRKELIIKGVWNSNYQQGKDDDWEEAIRIIGESPWIKRLVTHRIRLEKLPSILKELYVIKTNHQQHSILKVVVDFQ